MMLMEGLMTVWLGQEVTFPTDLIPQLQASVTEVRVPFLRIILPYFFGI